MKIEGLATVLGKTKTLDAEVIVRFTQSVNLTATATYDGSIGSTVE